MGPTQTVTHYKKCFLVLQDGSNDPDSLLGPFTFLVGCFDPLSRSTWDFGNSHRFEAMGDTAPCLEAAAPQGRVLFSGNLNTKHNQAV